MTIRLPTPDEWSFVDLARDDSACATLLEAAPAPDALISALESKLRAALRSGDARFGREQARENPGDYRAVVQLHVGAPLYNWFFNGRTGYRAHFRSSREEGLRFNERLIGSLRNCLGTERSSVFQGRELNCEFEDCGEADLPKEFALASLEPYLSKVWFCNKLIGTGGGVTQIMPSFTRPRISLRGWRPWTTLYAETEDVAWLDIKGAFLGPSGAYQPKCPVDRAGRLHEGGTA
jgi:hypothetical protein